jgi:predicted nucleic acid-binding protein
MSDGGQARAVADGPDESSPARVVADVDVLVADLLAGGAARDALDHVRAHSWVELVASDPLLDDATAVIGRLADDSLATDWRERTTELGVVVTHPEEDHPALASAYHGGAMHLLTFDDGLRTPEAGAAIRQHVEVSVKHPDAFASLFDPERLYPAVEGGDYPGPDRDPRA